MSKNDYGFYFFLIVFLIAVFFGKSGASVGIDGGDGGGGDGGGGGGD